MALKSETRIEATRLRKEGYSLSEIAALLAISKSTASLWLRGIELTSLAKERIRDKRRVGREKAANSRRVHTDAKIAEGIQSASNIVAGAVFNKDAERLLCALLYWCEGVKMRRSNTFAFTNSDPDLIRLFLSLFRKNFPIEEKKLRLQIHVHEYHDIEAQLQFWSKVTNIPLSQCNRPYQKPHSGKRIRDGYQGCASVRYLDTDLARRLEAIAIVFLKKQGP
jgi:predicted transcriptional regulator